MKTLVELSETIRDHLIKQHGKSQSEHGSCKYRSATGDMCAVGCLIDDKAYNAGLEGKRAADGLVQSALRLSGVLITDETTLVFLNWQSYHDGAHSFSIEHIFNYGEWIRTGDEAHSPTKFHEMIIELYTA